MDAQKPEEKGDSNAIDFNNLLTNLKTSSSDFSVLSNELKHSKYSAGEYWYSMGSRLLIILDKRLYRKGGYPSFSEYCNRELGYSRQHVYKLIKVVLFIDKQWAQAENQDQRKNVQRLFALGFTKLYLLHNLETSRLEHLLNNGITVPVNNLYPEQQVSIEETAVGQLRRALGDETTIKATRQPSSPRVQSYQYNLIPLLKTHSQSLLRLIENSQQEHADPDKLKEQLQLMREYTEAIVEIIDAITEDVPPAASTIEKGE
jgi:hypothetical protein